MQDAPTPPPIPDPYATSAAQTQGDVQSAIASTYMGNANERSPLGNVNYNQIGTMQIKDAQGNLIDVPRFERVTSLSPEQQALYDQQVRAGMGLNDLAISQIGRLQGLLGSPLDTSNIPGIVSNVGQAPTFRGPASTPGLATSFNPGAPVVTSYNPGGPIQTSVALNANAPTSFGQTAGNIQYGVGANDFSADRDKVVAALRARMNPELDRQRLALEQRLTNQGIDQGGEAWNRAIASSDRQYNDADLAALLAGGQEQSRLFGLDLSKGQFNNAAQNQDYTQQLGRGQFSQAGIGQNNAATLAMGQFANSAQAQQNGQNAALAAFNNAGAGQQFGQNQALAAFGNTALQQDYQNRQGAVDSGNQTLQQAYQNALTGGSFTNTAAAQALQRELALRNQPINEISALMSGGQVSMPQFAQFNPASVPGSTIGQNIYGSAGLQNQQYTTQSLAAAANNTGLYSLLGAGLGGIGRVAVPSDRRVKRDIELIGQTNGGHQLYSFKYLWDDAPHVGVMADEIEKIMPDAVLNIGGVKHVDYAMVA